jgi:uncharacterized membrane protein
MTTARPRPPLVGFRKPGGERLQSRVPMPTTAPLTLDAMDHALAGALSLIVAVAGWYYLFYSRAAQRLAGIEDPLLNVRRVRLRRVNGIVMLTMAGLMYMGFAGLDWAHPNATFVRYFLWVWAAVFALLVVMMVLVMLDVRLTAKLRERRRQLAAAQRADL